jgi:biotin operon repressor
VTSHRVLDALPWGRPNAITYAELAARTGLSRRQCEAAVEALRAGGASVCSGSTGLWLTADPEECLEHYQRLRGRYLRQAANARGLLRAAEQLRHQPTLWDAA